MEINPIHLTENEKEFIASRDGFGPSSLKTAVKSSPLLALGFTQYSNKQIALAQSRLWAKLLRKVIRG